MKVTITPVGDISFEVDNVTDALALAKALKNGAGTTKTGSQTVRRASGNSGGPADSITAYATWEYLVKHDVNRRGLGLMQVAKGMRISRAAAATRLCRLVKLGYADRVDVGRYAAKA